MGIGTDLFGDDFICIGSVFPMFVVNAKIHLKLNQTPETEKRIFRVKQIVVRKIIC